MCIYGENVESVEQLKTYVAELRSVLGDQAIIAIDEEGGEVTRVDYRTGSRFAGNGFLGKADDEQLTRRDGELIAQMLAGIGINLNLAPVADVNIEPTNPVIGLRSFGSNQQLVADHTAAFVSGHELVGVGTTLKHFPGHGNTTTDSHESLPSVAGGLEELRRTQFQPFISGIAAGASAVMLGHLDVGLQDPTSLSPEIVELLRNELEFSGLIVTDALDMGALGPREQLPQNAIRALEAGVDLVCLGPRTTLEELAEIERLWSDAGMQDKTNAHESAIRLERFTARKASATDIESKPDYPELAEISSDFTATKVYRLIGSSNPAVGEVPWYPGVIADQEVADVLSLREILSSTAENAYVMVRNSQQLDAVSTALTAAELERIMFVAPDMPIIRGNLAAMITNGTAQPQTKELAKLLAKGQPSHV